ncbi:MAG: type II secretion system protein GspL, partial [Pseudomonadota bacterium]
MAENLVVRLDDAAPERASWIVVDNAGAVAGSGGAGTLEDAAASAEHRRVVAIVPAADVLLTRASVPVKNTAKMLQAVPFALEDQLADDVDSLHFAVGKRGDDGQVPVAVARRQQVEHWLEALDEAGLHPAAMVPDTALIPANGTAGPTVVVDGDNTYLRQADDAVAVLDTATFTEVADAVGLGRQHEAHDEDDDDENATNGAPVDSDSASLFISQDDRERFPELVGTIETRFPRCQVHGLQSGAFPRLAASATASAPINLLQGAFAPSRGSARLFKPWRGVAALLVAFAVLMIGSEAVQLYTLKATDAELDEQIVTAYRQAFPDGRIVDPVAQMRNELNALTAGSDGGDTEFLEMIGSTATAVRAAPAAQHQNVRFARSQREHKITAPDVDTLDRGRAG